MECPRRSLCKRFSAHEGQTISHAVGTKEKGKTYEDFDKYQLAALARELHKKVTGQIVSWRSERWMETMDKLLAYCEDNDIDPEVYVKAQIDALSRWMVKNSRQIYSNMFQGNKALLRYQTYLLKNSDEGTRDRQSFDELKKESEAVNAEYTFAEAYVFVGDRKSAAISFTKKKFPNWSLGRARNNVRLKALSRLLNQLYIVNLDDSIYVKDKTWDWDDVSQLLEAIIEVRPQDFGVTMLDPDMGALI